MRRPAELFVSNVPNQSARTEPIRLIVLHDTEGGNVKGAADLRGVDSWFRNPASQASAHVTVDAEGNACQHVPDHRKAWACAQYNSRSVNLEQIGFMTQRHWPEAQLRKTAAYVAYWSQKYGIPLVHSTKHGVCQHKDLGEAGGNHADCGPHYPLARVLAMARELLTPPIRFSELERRLMRRKLTPAVRLALRAQARRVQLAARSTRHGWDSHDRARRFQALRRRAQSR